MARKKMPLQVPIKRLKKISEKKFLEICEGDLIYLRYDGETAVLYEVTETDDDDPVQPIYVKRVGSDEGGWPFRSNVYLMPNQVTVMDEWDAEDAAGMFMIHHFSKKLLARKRKAK